METETKDFKWYAISTLSGMERKARQLLLESIERFELESHFGEILIPTETVVELAAGKKRERERLVMPGYMFVQMILDGESRHVIKSTQKILGFVGNDLSPRPVPKREIARLRQEQEEGPSRATVAQVFEEGMNVRVIDGPFLNFDGVIEEVMAQKQKVRVLVSIFGRATPVELDFLQIQRT